MAVPQTAVEWQGGRSLKPLICSENNSDAVLEIYTPSHSGVCVCVNYDGMLRALLSNFLNNLATWGRTLLGQTTMGLLCAADDKGTNFSGSWRETETDLPTLFGWRNDTTVVTLLRASEPGAAHQGGKGINWLCWFFNCFHQTGLIKRWAGSGNPGQTLGRFIIAAESQTEKQQTWPQGLRRACHTAVF